MRVQPSWPNGTPGPCKIAIIGEAPDDMETYTGQPFVGPTGQVLDGMLAEAGIDRKQCLITNVLSDQPPGNSIPAFCLRKEELPKDYPSIGPIYTVGGNYYLHPDHLWEGARLRNELAIARPNVIIAMGAVAHWAMRGTSEIERVRGVCAKSVTSTPYKVLPTFHPAAVSRRWGLRPITIADLAKARAESQSPEIKYANAELWLEPTLDDMYAFEKRYMLNPHLDSVDIETRWGEIVCIGFAPTPDVAIVVPFRILDAAGSVPIGNYWDTPYEEKTAWLWVKRICEARHIRKVGQNFMFDMQYLLRYGIRVRRFTDDTMLAHHALYPELPKDLGFLGSVYTNHPSWKSLAGRHADELKKDA